MNKIYIVFGVGLFSCSVSAGLWDSLKQVGSGVADSVNGAANATVSASTNLYQSVKDDADKTTIKITTGVGANEATRMSMPVNNTVPSSRQGSSDYRSGDELAIAYLKGEFKDQADRLLQQGGGRYQNDYVRLWGYVNPEKGRGRAAYGRMRRVYMKDGTGVPNLIRAGGGAMVPTDLRQAERWVSDVRAALVAEENSLSRAGGVPQTIRDGNIRRGIVQNPTSSRQDVGVNRFSERNAMGDTPGSSVRIMDFLHAFEDARDEVKRLRSEIYDDKNYQTREQYYIDPNGQYETVRATGFNRYLLKDNVFALTLVRTGPNVPAKETDYIAWTNDVLSVMQKDIANMRRVIGLRKRFYAFLRDWEKIHRSYGELMSRFGSNNVELVKIDIPGGAEAVRDDRENNSVSQDFSARLRAAYCLDAPLIALCPNTEESLGEWISDTKAAYEERCVACKKTIKEVESLMADAMAGRQALKGVGGEMGKNLFALAFMDLNKAESMESAINSVLRKYSEMPTDVDAYLCDASLRSKLRTMVGDLKTVSVELSRNMEEKKKGAVAVAKEVRTWRAMGCAWTNVPTVVGLSMGMTTYDVGVLVTNTMFAQCDVEPGRSEFPCQRRYVASLVQGYPMVKDVCLEFGGHSVTQGLVLVRGSYSFVDDVPYEQLVTKHTTGLPCSERPAVCRKVVGYDLKGLQKRNPWAAWQIDYYPIFGS